MRFHSSIRLSATFALCLLGTVYAQLAPGGVALPAIWLQADADGLYSVVDDSRIPMVVHSEQLNYNYVGEISSVNRGVNLDIDAEAMRAATVFVVCQTNDYGNERIIWSMSYGDTTAVVMTNKHVADLREGYYTETRSDRLPRAATFVHSRNISFGGDIGINLFSSPKDLPLQPFAGLIAEYIVFDRILSEIERIQVETYLAVKWGIPLNQLGGSIYLDAQGELIWASSDHTPFTFGVTGIGRDTMSALRQLQSMPYGVDGWQSISIGEHRDLNAQNINTLNSNDYIIWAHDPEPLQPGETQVGPVRLKRQWKIQPTSSRAYTTEVIVNTDYLEWELTDEHVWLQIERRPGTTEYVKGHKDGRSKFVFDSIVWDEDNSGTDRFTYLFGPEFFVTGHWDETSCLSDTNTIVKLQMVGGSSPYTIRLESSGDNSSEVLIDERAQHETSLRPGIYYLEATDGRGRSFRDTIVINSLDGPEIQLTASDDGFAIESTVSIHTNTGNGTMYNWHYPSGKIISGNEAWLSEEGLYIVAAERNGCSSYEQFETSSSRAQPVFEHIAILPNPVTSGDKVRFRVRLRQDSELTYTLMDASGRLLDEVRLAPSTVFVETLRAPAASGTYTITFSTGSQKHSHQIVVVR